MYQPLDSKGNTHIYFQEIMDHKCDEAKHQDIMGKQQKDGIHYCCGRMDPQLGRLSEI
jgi:hypothetical protein